MVAAITGVLDMGADVWSNAVGMAVKMRSAMTPILLKGGLLYIELNIC